MAQRKGQTGNPNGRPKGSKNKSNELAREAIARFVDGNVERLEGWLEEIAADSPKDAFNCFKDLLEYHVPKLQRTELNQRLVDEEGKDLSRADKEVLARYGIDIKDL